MKTFLILLFLLGICIVNVLTLRCQTNDGLSEQEVRQVLKKCMRKMSDNPQDRNYEEYENYDDGDEEDGKKHRTKSNSNNNNPSSNYDYRYWNNNNNNNNPPSSYEQPSSGRMNYPKGRPNGRYKRKSGDNHQKPNNYYNGYSYNAHNGFSNNNNNMTSEKNNNNSTDDDHSCMLQCFFQELKMVNQDGFPDKHKVLHVLTKELNDHELKDFYTDSIQECFHVLELEQRREKCQYAKHLITCLAERAKSNCNDWNGNVDLF